MCEQQKRCYEVFKEKKKNIYESNFTNWTKISAVTSYYQFNRSKVFQAFS